MQDNYAPLEREREREGKQKIIRKTTILGPKAKQNLGRKPEKQKSQNQEKTKEQKQQ